MTRWIGPSTLDPQKKQRDECRSRDGTTPLNPPHEEPNPHPGAAFNPSDTLRATNPYRCIVKKILRAHWHVRRPCGNGSVQFCVVPFNVITTFAVAVPSYVTTSRRVDVVGVCPVIATVADIERMI
jgi:hypothetical protein